jgi:hypothetical protein
MSYNAKATVMPPAKVDPAIQLTKRLRILLWSLAGVLISEGVLRKLFGTQIGNWIFFAKDAITIGLVLILFFHRFTGSVLVLLEAYGAFFFAMLVPFALTLGKDPVLALFGLKHYVLFPAVAFALAVAFSNSDRDEVRKFYMLPVLLLVPVTLVALGQLRLPVDNWLNQSVGGTSVGGFSSGGHLRVSSTFSFVAQYAMYLNASVYLLGAFLLIRRIRTKASVWVAVGLCGLLIVSSFVTGSRTAVLGNATILCIGGGLLLAKGGGKGSALFIGIVLAGGLALAVARQYLPEAFEAYAARTSDAEQHTAEIKGRVADALYNWMDGIGYEAPPTLFGYGLGVMSNGADKISRYAATWRNQGTWGEVDLANTLFEGGWYLVVVWMAFRLFTVSFAIGRILKLRDPQLSTAGSLAGGYIVLEGTFGAMGIQPPISIWFWLAVGTVMVLEELDRRSEAVATPPLQAALNAESIRPQGPVRKPGQNSGNGRRLDSVQSEASESPPGGSKLCTGRADDARVPNRSLNREGLGPKPEDVPRKPKHRRPRRIDQSGYWPPRKSSSAPPREAP